MDRAVTPGRAEGEGVGLVGRGGVDLGSDAHPQSDDQPQDQSCQPSLSHR